MKRYRQRKKGQSRKQSSQMSVPTIQRVDERLLQRAIENPKPENLTPDVVMQLQRTYGNQFVNGLVQRTQQSDGQVAIQRKFPPENNRKKVGRDRAFASRQAGVKLKDAFLGAVNVIDSNVSTPGATFTKWKETEGKKAGLIARRRINGYKTVMEVIRGGNLDDWVSIKMFSEADYTDENFKFLKAAHTYASTASDTRFHQLMDHYIYNDSPKTINIDRDERNGLIERAYRMMQGTVDSDGNDIGDDDSIFEETNMTTNPLAPQQT